MDDFEKELKVGFLEEASQLLTDCEKSFLELEQNPGNMDIINQLFRLAHNIKGSSKAVGFNDLGEFTHKLESLLLKVKNGELKVDLPIMNIFLKSNDHLNLMISSYKDDLDAKIDSTELIGNILEYLEGKITQSSDPTAEAPVVQPTPSPADMVAVEAKTTEVPSADQFEEEPVKIGENTPENVAEAISAPVAESNVVPINLNKSEAQQKESVNKLFDDFAKDTVAKSVAPVEVAKPKTDKPAEKTTSAAPKDESIRVSLERVEKLINYVGEMVILETVLKAQSIGTTSLLMKKTIDQLGKVTKEIQDLSMSLRMMPLKQTFQKMQRIVRDTSSALNKKVNFIMSGEETELDKTVLEHLSDPLVHLIRNAVDHGIESAESRKERGKSETGEIRLRAYHEGGNIVIEAKDDGGGVDAARIRKKAIEKGVIKENSNLSDKELQMLIFHPGFSIKSEVTDISGRGVGLDVVKTNIERLQGHVDLESVVGVGTTFKIYLPLTLAIIDAMVVKLAQDRFVIPLAHIHELMRYTKDIVHTITGVGEVLVVRGEKLPLFRLSTLLNKKVENTKIDDSIVIIVRANKSPFAVLVDDVIGQHQVVIKKLGGELHSYSGYAGSAILGDGKPALIVELPELVNKLRGKSSVQSLGKVGSA